MSDIDNPAIAAYETMKEKGYTPEEIETFLEFLEQTIGRSTDHLELLMYGTWVLVLIAPRLTQKFSSWKLFGS